MGCVYIATSKTSGKSYVGKTIHSLRKRKNEHKSAAKLGSSQHFCRAIRKYGFSDFTWKAVFHSDSNELLCEEEKRLIKLYSTKSPHGYNLTSGGEGLEDPCDITRTRISNTVKELWDDPVYREKMLEAAKNRPPVADATRKKLKQTGKANWENPEFVRRMEEINAERTRLSKEKKAEYRRKNPKKSLAGKSFEDIYGDKADEQREKIRLALQNNKKVASASKKSWENPERKKKAKLSYEEKFGPEKAAEIRRRQSEAMIAVQQRKRELQNA